MCCECDDINSCKHWLRNAVGEEGIDFFLACSPDVPNVIHRVFPIGTESSRWRIIEGRFCYTECFGFLETRTYVKNQLVFQDGQDAWEVCSLTESALWCTQNTVVVFRVLRGHLITMKVPLLRGENFPVLHCCHFHSVLWGHLITTKVPQLRRGTRDFSDLACSVDVLYAH